MMPATCSMLTESLIVFGSTPAVFCCSRDICRCVVEAGGQAIHLASPILTIGMATALVVGSGSQPAVIAIVSLRIIGPHNQSINFGAPLFSEKLMRLAPPP